MRARASASALAFAAGGNSRPGRRRGTLAAALIALVAGCAGAPPTTCAPTLDLCAVTSDGWILQAARAGEETPRWALLVHGLNEDHHAYDALAADLARAGWRVIALDSRGHGASTHRTDGSTRTLQQFDQRDFAGMERDVDAIHARVNAPPALLVGASLGANEVLRASARLDPHATLVLLSSGLDYRGLTTRDANAAHQGRALFLASEEDAYAASSARSLAAQHASPRDVKVWNGKGHGTNLLDAQARAFVLAWVANATQGPAAMAVQP